MKETTVVKEKEVDPFAQFERPVPVRYLSQPFTRSLVRTEPRRRQNDQMTDSFDGLGIFMFW